MDKMKMSTETVRRLKGKRLEELLKLNNYSQAELIRLTIDKFGDAYSISRPHLNDIIKGRRTLSEQFAVKFAYILEADPGYLTGSDEYESKNYTEYNERKAANHFAAYGRYDSLLNPVGYKVFSYVSNEATHGCYGIRYKDAISFVPGTEMEQFLEDVYKYIDLRIKPILLTNQIPEDKLDDFDLVFEEGE